MHDSRPPTASADPGRTTGPEPWERKMLERLLLAGVAEQRRNRRWGIFFKLLLALYLLALLAVYWPGDLGELATDTSHTALVELEGVIAAGAKANADDLAEGLRDAFEDDHTRAVVLRINSPGGSPVQAADIYAEIQRLRKKHPKIPLYAVVTDLCASGGYYVAAAADKIYANRSSLVGSIGVRMGGFGFVETLDKLGIERRLLTAGEHKGFLDPFSPLKPDEVAHVQRLLHEVHAQFIEAVKKGRGERLKNDEQVFSGLIWTGEDARDRGLVDAFGSTGSVARDVVGAEKIVDYTVQPRYLDRLAKRLGAALGTALGATLGQGRLEF